MNLTTGKRDKAKRNLLISYAAEFMSFLVERLGTEIEEVYLFGSVARGDFGKDSDIDVFVETRESEEKVRSVLELFEKSEMQKKYEMKGVKNPISLRVGRLADWELEESVKESGIVLYGRASEKPNYSLFILRFSGNKSNKVSVWRKLYGYTQKTGGKEYVHEGFVEDMGGRKMGRGVVAIPREKAEKFKKFLEENDVKFEELDIRLL